VPRYTSYPTAVHFSPAVDAEKYAEWLGGIAPQSALALYLHIPFCRELCWYCGCHTAVARNQSPIDDYVETLLAEIDLVSKRIGHRARVSSVHFGGGSPNTLSTQHLQLLFAKLHDCFVFSPDAAIAAELDPRTLSSAWIRNAARLGMNRASLGVQVFDPNVQAAINRRQSYDLVRHTVETLREEGIEAINFDLMYGLPRQTTRSLLDTVEQSLDLKPQRMALFGYAHVPWMMARQRLIRDEDLPSPTQRLQQQVTAAASLKAAGYVPIGLDHFARPEDALAIAAETGGLHRNFQGYTAERADHLVGFGASSISSFAAGFAQNIAAVPKWRAAIRAGQPAIARGLILTADDRFRAAIIERLMCTLTVDLAELSRSWQRSLDELTEELARLTEMESDGLLSVKDYTIAVTEPGRPFLRNVCAAFDRYLLRGEGAPRHALAI
jgi:oxygen-independent coproporphyrinogen-3 oxidase